MEMAKITKRVLPTSAWAASSDLTPVALPREGLITEIGIRASITTAALTATAVADGMRRVIQNLKIEGDGGRAFLGLSGEQMGRVLNFMNECDHQCAMQDSLMPEVGDTVLPDISWVFHPGSNPKDPFDLSAVIPARALATLQILLSTTADTLIDANAAIASGTFSYWINQVMGFPVPRDIMTPTGSTLVQDLAATMSDHSFKIDVPAGAWLRRIVFLIQDDTGVPERIDTEITSVRLELPKSPGYTIELPIQDLKVMTAKRYGLSGFSMNAALGAVTTRPGWEVEKVLPKGLFIIDLRDYAEGPGKLYGLDLTGYQTGDIKLGLTVSVATGEVIIYWDQLMPVEAQYVGK